MIATLLVVGRCRRPPVFAVGGPAATQRRAISPIHRGHLSVRHVTFLCCGLSEGRNGVGDYCLQLAHSLAELDVRSDVLAVADPFCDDPVEAEREAPTSRPIRIARLPAAIALRRRAAMAEAILGRWQPDWVSLQYVSYGFNPKGIAFREPFWLPRLLRPYRRSVMMHELWLGVPPNVGLRHQLVGMAQRAATLALVRRLEPNAIATSNPYYRDLLAARGVAADVLPLFSNIPVRTEPAEPWLGEAIRAAGGPDIAGDRGRYWLVGMFGGILGQWQPRSLFARLAESARRTRRQILVVAAGHAGPFAAEQFARLRELFPDITFLLIGPQPPELISRFLNGIDVGLSSYPFDTLGRSGSVAAMLEHGLPVISGWDDEGRDQLADWSAPVDPTFASSIWRNDDDLIDRLSRLPLRHPRPDWRNIVARRFLKQLEDAAPPGTQRR